MNRTLKIIAFLLLGVVTFTATGQSTDLARIEYTYFPQSDSDNSFRRFRTFVNLPIKLNDKGAYLIPGVEYRNVNFKYKNSEAFTTNNLDRFQSFTGKIGYTSKMNKLWRFGVETGLKVASNFATNELIKDDFIYTGSVYFIKIKEDERYVEPWRLILGLSYSTTTGFPFPLPVVNYYKRFDENWSYGLGIPKTNLKYYFNNKHEVQGFVSLDGFFANIQNKFNPYPQTKPGANLLADSMSMTIVLSGLGYQYNITDHIAFYTYAGYTLMNDIRLRDKDREDLYTIDEKNSFYARSGLKFNIL